MNGLSTLSWNLWGWDLLTHPIQVFLHGTTMAPDSQKCQEGSRHPSHLCELGQRLVQGYLPCNLA